MNDRIGWLSWWKLSDWKEEATFEAHKSFRLDPPAVSPDGQLVATSASDLEVKLWHVASHSPAGVLRGHLLGTHSVAFSPAGDRLASGSDGKEAVKIWDLATYQDVATLPGTGNLFDFVLFSPDGNLVLALNSPDKPTSGAHLRSHKSPRSTPGTNPSGVERASANLCCRC